MGDLIAAPAEGIRKCICEKKTKKGLLGSGSEKFDWDGKVFKTYLFQFAPVQTVE